MGGKSRPTLGRLHLAQDYAAGQCPLTLIRIPKSANLFQKIYSLQILLTQNYNGHTILKIKKSRFLLLLFFIGFFSASEKTDIC